jgi:hypothetical protein
VVKILIAGYERFLKTLSVVPKNILISYYYRGSLSAENFRKLRDTSDIIMIDSGAHTFHAAMGASGVKSAKDHKLRLEPPEYTHEYCKWLVKHKKCIDYYVELDITKAYNWKLQLELRDIFTSYNLDPIPVYHHHNEETFEELCRKHDFVGIGTSGSNVDYLSALLSIAQKHKTRVHIFAFTRPEKLRTLCAYKSFYTTDSTSWNVGGKYGMMLYFNGVTLDHLSRPKFFKKFGQDFVSMNYKIRDDWNLRQFIRYGEYLERVSPSYSERELAERKTI